MDVHVPRAITNQLRLRGVDVLTAQVDGTGQSTDEKLLERATELGRVLFSRDDDLVRLAAQHQSTGVEFAGVVFAHQLQVSIGRCVEDLEMIAKICEPNDLQNRVEFLPL